MSTTTTTTTTVLLPVIVFLTVAYAAVQLIFGHLFQSQLADHLQVACSPHDNRHSQYRLVYTGLQIVDQSLCPLVTFFHAALNDLDASNGLTYFFAVAAPFITIPTVESCRPSRTIFKVALPLIVGLLSQSFTIGVTFPIYWLIFLLSGGARVGWVPTAPDATITQAHAEAVIFGLLVGAVIPSIAMLVLEDPIVTAIWQPYPAYVSLAQFFHLFIRPASTHSTSGYNTIRFLYITLFIFSSSIHIATIWPLLTDLDIIFKIYLPSFTVPAHTLPVGTRVLHFLKWDIFFGFGSSILASLWFARSALQFFTLLAWNAFAILFFGPGAALAGTALWRESSLQNKIILKVKES
ncbi:hypothetical protein H0H93_009303 [Arthromyces matolae]|nr:hypothetical protein H0H93_009303 [Arthromyces matolae]